MTEETNYNAKQCKYEKLSFRNFSVHKATNETCVCVCEYACKYDNQL